MTTRQFKLNLQDYLTPLVSVDVVLDEVNQDIELPCVVIQTDAEQMNDFMFGHYVVEGAITVLVHSADDTVNNDQLESLTQEVNDALADLDSLMTAVNPPDSGPDERPASNFTLHDLFVTGQEVEHDGQSSAVSISFEAYTYAGDN